MDDQPSDKIRKTVSLTKGQAGISAASIAAVAALLVGPLSSVFQTKDEGKAAEVRLVSIERTQVDIKKTIEDNDKEAVRRQERSNDKIIARIQEAEARTATNQDRIEHRVDTLEASIINGKRHSN